MTNWPLVFYTVLLVAPVAAWMTCLIITTLEILQELRRIAGSLRTIEIMLMPSDEPDDVDVATLRDDVAAIRKSGKES